MSGRHRREGADPENESASDPDSQAGEHSPDDDFDSGETGAEARAEQD